VIVAGPIARAGRIEVGWLETSDRRVCAVGSGAPPRPADIESSGLIAPGLIDLQVNGAAGVEVVGGEDAIDAIDAHELSHGVTSYLPTIITTDDETALRAVAELGERSEDPFSPVAGIHLEGPFLSSRYRGVHRKEFLRSPSEGLPAYYEHPAVRLVTLAPELPGALNLIQRLVARGVTVSLGHTDADESVAEEAADSGATLITHIFNAMTAIHHRAAGLAGWGLTSGRIVPCVIADGLHVERPVLELVRRAAGDRVILVTDSSVASGAKPGFYRQAGIAVHLGDDRRAVNEDDDLAGSAISLDEAVDNWTQLTGADLATSLDAATCRPAAAIALGATLEVDEPANLIMLDQAGRLGQVMHNGDWVRSTS
jgi:N-acetylglucosamine-6-phosphate deacetylase